VVDAVAKPGKNIDAAEVQSAQFAGKARHPAYGREILVDENYLLVPDAA